MEYYSALKGKEIVKHATTWMNLEDIMLSEISQMQKDVYCMIALVVKFIEIKNTKVVARDWEWEVIF